MRKLLLFCFALVAFQMSFGQLTGTKTIPGDYATIEAAITALNTQGVGSGGVTFNVAANHTETFSNALSGSITATGTLADPIIFQKSGAGANPLITASGLGTVSSSTSLLSHGDGIIIIEGGDYITFDGIDLQENPGALSGTEYTEFGYYLKKASGTDAPKNITIKNCDISLNNSTIYSWGIYVSNISGTSTVTVTSIGGRSENIKIFNNNFSNVYGAIHLRGYADSAPYDFYDQNIEIGVDGGNTITDFGGGSTLTYGIYSIYQNDLKIMNNSFTGTITSNSTTYAIFTTTSLNSNIDISYNSLLFTFPATTSTLHGISNAAGGSGTSNTVNINNNTVTIDRSEATSGIFYPIYNSGAAYYFNCFENSIINNIHGSNTSTATGTFGAIYTFGTNSNAGSTWNIYDNVITGNQRTQSTLGSGTTYYIYNSSSGVTLNIYDNLVDNNTSGSTGTAALLWVSSSAANKNIYNNTLTNLNFANGTTYGLYSSAGGDVAIYNNKIRGITFANSTTSIVYGIYIASGTAVNTYNNFISEIYAPQASNATAVRGIHVQGGTTQGLYNNTIYLDASSTNASFGSAGIYAVTTPTVEMRNNIVVNVSTPGSSGFTAAYWRSSTTLSSYATTSNNNDFFAGTPGPNNLIYYDGTNADQTLDDFKARVSPADASSVTENPPFVNKVTQPYDLHLLANVPTQLESGGAEVSTPVNITTDFDGDPRFPNAGYPDNPGSPATAPDIGADEFGGIGIDLTPPNIAFTPLQNTSSTINRVLTTIITDATGVPTAGIGLPVLYWKINAGTWNSATAVWEGSDEYSFTFGAGVTIGDVVYYYIVAQDEVTPTPNIGANPSGGASGYTADPPAVAVPPDTPYEYTILGSICGTFQVGTGQTYPTITAALADLVLNEVTCPVIFELTDATYDAETLPVVFLPVAGASDVNTITFRPAAGVSPTITGSSSDAIFKFEGGQYFVIDGSNLPGGTTRDMTIENTSTSTNSTSIWFSSTGVGQGSTNNVIRNCNVKAGTNTVTSTFGIFIGGETISITGTGADNNNILIENNQISRTYNGIYARGVPSVGELMGLVIKDNVIGADVDTDYVTGYGMRLQSINGAYVIGNEVYNMIYDGSKYGIWMGTYISNSVVSRNNIHAMGQIGTSASYYCIAMYFSSGTGTSNNEISNNVIYDLDQYGSTSTFYGPIGIRIIGGTGYKVWHNSISLTGAFGSSTAGVYSHCLFMSTATSNMDLRNNIFYNARTGNDPRAYTVYTVSTSTFDFIDYNDYYTTGSAFGYYGSEIATFADWQVATGQDLNSMNMDPQYTSPTNLMPTNMAIDNMGIYLPEVPKDYDFVSRTNPPDAGAYEFGTNPEVITLDASDITCEGAMLNGTINANGLTINAFFDYGETDAYGNTVTGVPDVVTGSTTTAITAMLTGLSGNTTYHFRLRGVGPGGVISYGEDMTFTTNAAGAPTAETQSVTSITSTSATLNGMVNANCFSTVVTFEYGTTPAYGSTITAIESPVTGGLDTPVSADLAGLITGQTYHYRVVGENSEGTTYGMDMTFTTGANPPTVTTEPATNIGNFTATLNGTVNANNLSSTVTFEWGLTDAYGNTIGATPGVVTGDVTTPVYADLAGLDYNTTYHFRCVATNVAGTTYGADEVFTTLCPVPMAAGAITGPTSVCQSTVGHVYTVAPITYATGYEWTLPAGGTITAGANTNSITVSYSSSAVSGNVAVFGTNVCGSGAQSLLAVTVNATPVPTITGADMSCIGDSETYTTEAGMTGYVWTVSAGGTITAGAGTESITVQWNQTGAQYVTVDYTSAAGCPAAAPTMLNVSIGDLPTPTIAGSNMMCVGSGNHLYTTEGGFSGYTWTVSSGGTIVSGQGTYQIEVTWTVPGSQSVSINYENAFGCSAPSPTSMSITVLALPAPAGTITGTAELCEGTLSVAYSVDEIADATSYMWSIPEGAFISGGAGTNAIRVDFPIGASSGAITVYGVNGCGDGPVSPPFQVTVYPIPPAPVITMDDNYLLTSSAPEGNQWYLNGDAIEGATGQTYQVEEEGTYWTVVTLNGCVSDESNQIDVIFTGLDELPGTSVSIYPVPNKGVFTIAIRNTGMESYSIAIYNALGMKVYEDAELTVDGQFLKTIDLGSGAKGIHTIVLRSGKNSISRRVLITN